VKNFPNAIEHTIQVSRPGVSGAFFRCSAVADIRNSGPARRSMPSL
jgi:hypothetical protein